MNTNFRIEQIQRVFLNGRRAKVFSAFQRRGNAFVFAGYFSAPVRTANRNLWKIVADGAQS